MRYQLTVPNTWGDDQLAAVFFHHGVTPVMNAPVFNYDEGLQRVFTVESDCEIPDGKLSDDVSIRKDSRDPMLAAA